MTILDQFADTLRSRQEHVLKEISAYNGLTEARDSHGQEYGVEALQAARQPDPETAQALLEYLLADLVVFSGPVVPANDITLCVLQCDRS